MKRLILVATMLFTNVVWAQSTVQSSVETAAGLVTCGGRVDREELKFSAIPLTQILQAEDSKERVLLYIDLSVKDRAKLVFVWGPDADEKSEIDRVSNTDELRALKKWSGDLRTIMWVGFVGRILHMEFERAKHVLSISCRVE